MENERKKLALEIIDRLKTIGGIQLKRGVLFA